MDHMYTAIASVQAKAANVPNIVAAACTEHKMSSSPFPSLQMKRCLVVGELPEKVRGGEDAVCHGEIGQKVPGCGAQVFEVGEGEEDEGRSCDGEDAHGSHRHLQRENEGRGAGRDRPGAVGYIGPDPGCIATPRSPIERL
ncbi:hypothetical protein GBAR_LOCUS27408 [Geodia barretti]|uniref:Uncharacterized protein n=1 Tax=Geodia barretti TaxID=519541 RepID=A0AA35TLG3_GEOBA|nr:hypothetical protein GBAR_LOCUS27408 [Geodia barretti]